MPKITLNDIVEDVIDHFKCDYIESAGMSQRQQAEWLNRNVGKSFIISCRGALMIGLHSLTEKGASFRAGENEHFQTWEYLKDHPPMLTQKGARYSGVTEYWCSEVDEPEDVIESRRLTVEQLDRLFPKPPVTVKSYTTSLHALDRPAVLERVIWTDGFALIQEIPDDESQSIKNPEVAERMRAELIGSTPVRDEYPALFPPRWNGSARGE